MVFHRNVGLSSLSLHDDKNPLLQPVVLDGPTRESGKWFLRLIYS